MTNAIKTIESFEPKVRKLGSERPKKIPIKMGKRIKQFVIRNKSLGSRKIAPKMVDKFNVKVYSRTVRREKQRLRLGYGAPNKVSDWSEAHQDKKLK